MVTTQQIQSLAESIDGAVKAYCEERERDDTKTRGDGFAIWCLMDIFGFDRESAVDSLVDGADDRSIDAIADDGNRLIVLQAKYNSHDWAEVTKFQEDVRAIAMGQATQLPSRLRRTAARIRDRQKTGLPVASFYLTNGRFTGGDASRIGSLQSDPAIEALDLDGIADLLSERESERPANSPGHTVNLRPDGDCLPFGDSLIMPVSLPEFARFVLAGQKWLFDSNVRQYLAKSRINQGIRETVSNEPSHFWRYNNGVTMVVDDFELQADGTVGLLKPQIVNGCQTSLSIARVVEEMDAGERADLEGSLLIRIIKESADSERQKITLYTNKQNAVRGKDFFALKDFQQRLKRQIDRLGYFYEIQTGSFDFLDRSKKESLKGDSRYAYLEWARRDYRIPAIEAAKCNAASKGTVAVCYANPGDLAPNGELYDVIFPNDLPTAPEPFLLPFLIMKHGEKALGYGSPKGDSWRRRGRYVFVFAVFRLLKAALVEAERLELEEEISDAALREVVTRPDAAIQLMTAADKVLENFFSDTAIEKKVNDDIFAYLKGPIQRKESIDVLDSKITRMLRSNEGRALVNHLQQALPS